MAPGVQKPHWKAPCSMKASCTGSSFEPDGQVLDGDHLGAVHERREIEAARHRAAVDQHRAAAAQALAAALARAMQVALLQQLDQVLVHADLGGNLGAVEGEIGSCVSCHSPSMGFAALNPSYGIP